MHLFMKNKHKKKTRSATKPSGQKVRRYHDQWYRRRHPGSGCRVPVSHGSGFDPGDHISIAQGADTFKIKIAEEAQDRNEVSVLLEQKFPDWCACGGGDQVDPVRVIFLRIVPAEAPCVNVRCQ